MEATSAVETRLAALRTQAASGAERLQAGVLLYASAGGVIAGMVLPESAPPETLTAAGEDLVALLDGLARRPLLERAMSEDEGRI
ncbi:MAG TPA: hypothetical protein VEI47_01490, partial [Gemmatimonadales bacterium]|nr:hypothetical protein [Gemmatimonadales bacterium]